MQEDQMQDLRLVAANEAGSHLLLRSQHGDEFRLPIDERLRAATRGDGARPAQAEVEPETELRPRDIQARIRAGESAEAVARSAGVPVERVRRFEGPVLAERAHTAQMAQRASVRRPEGPSAVLGEAVAARLDPLGVRDEVLDWDSWRREDGRWTVLLSYQLDRSPQRAGFVYDPRARTTVPDDDEARWLVGDLAERPGPVPFVPRLATEPEEPEADGSADEQPPPITRPERPERPRRVSAMDILVPPTSAVARPDRPARPARPERPAQPERPTRPEPPARPAARVQPASAEQARHPAFLGRRDQPPQRAASQPPQPVQPQPAAATVTPQVVPREERLTGTTDAGPDRPVERSASRPGTRNRRASVPSWDEILFGTRRRGE